MERKGDARGRRKAMRELGPPVMPQALQLTLFASEPDPLVEELKVLAVDEMTPLEALTTRSTNCNARRARDNLL